MSGRKESIESIACDLILGILLPLSQNHVSFLKYLHQLVSFLPRHRHWGFQLYPETQSGSHRYRQTTDTTLRGKINIKLLVEYIAQEKNMKKLRD